MAETIITYDFSTSAGRAYGRSYEGTTLHDSFKIGNSSSTASCPVSTMCISFTTPENGCNNFRFNITNAYWVPTGSSNGKPLVSSNGIYTHVGQDASKLFRFAISESDTEFMNTNNALVGDGYVSCVTNETKSDGFFTLTGEVTKNLQGNTTYYLWLFPCYDFASHYRYWALNGYYYKPLVTFVLSGDFNDSQITSTILWAFDGEKWVEGVQRVYDGNSWL